MSVLVRRRSHHRSRRWFILSSQQRGDALAIDGSMRGGAPDRLDLLLSATFKWCGASRPADGGGEGGVVAFDVALEVSRLDRLDDDGAVAGDFWSTGAQTWSPIEEISTFRPQFEHLIMGKKPRSIDVISAGGFRGSNP